MRVLAFKPEDPYYDVCYGAMIVNSYHGTDTRVACRIIEALEQIGRTQPDGIYALESEGEAKLEEAEFRLLKSTVESTAWKGTVVHRAVRTMEWLDKQVEIRP